MSRLSSFVQLLCLLAILSAGGPKAFGQATFDEFQHEEEALDASQIYGKLAGPSSSPHLTTFVTAPSVASDRCQNYRGWVGLYVDPDIDAVGQFPPSSNPLASTGWTGASYTCTMIVNVTYYTFPSMSASTPVPETLAVSYDNKDRARSRESHWKRIMGGSPPDPLENVYRVDVDVVSCTTEVTLPGPTVTTYYGATFIPDNLKLEARIQHRDLLLVDDPDDDLPTADNLTIGAIASDLDYVPVSWDQVDDAVEYDLEWTFIPAFTDDGSSTPFAEPFTRLRSSYVNFRHGATRVTTRATNFDIPFHYEQGHLAVRVRAVGRRGEDCDGLQRVEGPWTAPDAQGFDPSDPAPWISGEFDCREQNLNWQYAVSFAEGPKHAPSASYFDGSLRNRQQVALNTDPQVGGAPDKVAVVSETFYDWAGRGHVQTLPVPAINPIGSETSEGVLLGGLRYYAGFHFNQSDPPRPYTRRDEQPASESCHKAATSMSSDRGSALYYSDNEDRSAPLQEGFQAYVPDAQGFAFSQTIFESSPLGRVEIQGGVGPDHQPNGPRALRHLYVNENQSELDRLFGTEVGWNSYYFRTLIFDPNGTVTVNITDLSNRLIASGLGGDVPADHLLPLNPASSERELVEDVRKEGKSWFDEQNLALVLTKDFAVEKAGEQLIDYSISSEAWNALCGLCSECAYTLSVSLRDQCGFEYLDDARHRLGAYLPGMSCEEDFEFDQALEEEVSFSHDSRLDVGSDPFTVEFWVKPTTLSNTTLISKGNPATGAGWSVSLTVDGEIVADLNDGSERLKLTTDEHDPSTSDPVPPVQEDELNHVALVRRGGVLPADFDVYVNGKRFRSDFEVVKLAVDPTHDALEDGDLSNTTAVVVHPSGLSGQIDELKLFRRALTEAEIQHEHNEGCGNLSRYRDDLVLHVPFNEVVEETDGEDPPTYTYYYLYDHSGSEDPADPNSRIRAEVSGTGVIDVVADAPACSTFNEVAFHFERKVGLEVGKYTITRVLQLDVAALESYLREVEEKARSGELIGDPEDPCVKSEASYIEDALDAAAYSGCYGCGKCAEICGECSTLTENDVENAGIPFISTRMAAWDTDAGPAPVLGEDPTPEETAAHAQSIARYEAARAEYFAYVKREYADVLKVCAGATANPHACDCEDCVSPCPSPCADSPSSCTTAVACNPASEGWETLPPYVKESMYDYSARFGVSSEDVNANTGGWRSNPGFVAELERVIAEHDNLSKDCGGACGEISDCDVAYKAMLADMSPGGQYGQYLVTDPENENRSPDDVDLERISDLTAVDAKQNSILFVPSEDESGPFNPLFNQICKPSEPSSALANFQHPVTPYLDPDGTESKVWIDGEDGTRVQESPQNLSATLFVKHWRASWAHSLAPYHPEFCRYLACSLNQSQQEYARKMLLVDTYAEAFVKGFLNPLNLDSENLPAGINPVSDPEPEGYEGVDPLCSAASMSENACLSCTTQAGTIETDLGTHMVNVNESTLSLWDIAKFTVLCDHFSPRQYPKPVLPGEIDQRGIEFENDEFTGDALAACMNETNPYADETLAVELKDRIWLVFRGLYLSKRAELLAEQCTCSTACTVDYPGIRTAGKDFRFPHQMVETMGGQLDGASDLTSVEGMKGARDAVKRKIAQDCGETCSGMAVHWMEQLSGCLEAIEDEEERLTKSNTLQDRLIRICASHCDVNNPFGALPKEQVETLLNELFGETLTVSCNPFTLNYPLEADHKYFYEEGLEEGHEGEALTRMDDCTCEAVREVFCAVEGGITEDRDRLVSYLTAMRNDSYFAEKGVSLTEGEIKRIFEACCYQDYFPAIASPGSAGAVRGFAVLGEPSLDRRTFIDIVPAIEGGGFTSVSPFVDPDQGGSCGFIVQNHQAGDSARWTHSYAYPRRYGGKPLAIAKTSDQYFVLSALSNLRSLHVAALDSKGMPLWSRTLENTSLDGAEAQLAGLTSSSKLLQATADGGCLIAGSRFLAPDSLGLLPAAQSVAVKINWAGGIEWQRAYAYNRDTLEAVSTPASVTAHEGGYALTGTAMTATATRQQMAVTGTDGQGRALWTYSYAHESADTSLSGCFGQVRPDGSMLLAGALADSSTTDLFSSLVFLQADSTGALLKSRRLNLQTQELGTLSVVKSSLSVAADSDGGLLVSGTGKPLSAMPSGIERQGFVFKLDRNLEFVWSSVMSWDTLNTSVRSVKADALADACLVAGSASALSSPASAPMAFSLDRAGNPSRSAALPDLTVEVLPDASITYGSVDLGHYASVTTSSSSQPLNAEQRGTEDELQPLNEVASVPAGYMGRDREALPWVPRALTCDCPPCSSVWAAKAAFDAYLSGTLDAASLHEEPDELYYRLRANFMNRQLGLNLTDNEYEDFLGAGSTTLEEACPNLTAKLCNRSLFPRGEIKSDCYETHHAAVTRNAKAEYEAYLDGILRDFRRNYIDGCLRAVGTLNETFTRTCTTNTYQFTLYYYDRAGNLVRTVPPKGIGAPPVLATVESDRVAVAAEYPAHDEDYYSEYRYNSMGLRMEQKTPDGGITEFWHDRLGQPAASQNARQAAVNKFGYALSDGLNRPREAGEIEQTEIDYQTLDADELFIADNHGNLVNRAAFMAWVAETTAVRRAVVRTHWDAPPSVLFPTFYSTEIGTLIEQGNLRGRISWVARFGEGTAFDPEAPEDYESATYYAYDAHGNAQKILQDLAGLESQRFTLLEYDYDLIAGHVNQLSYKKGSQDEFYFHYEYDGGNRLREAWSSLNGTFWDLDARYRYYLHGPLARVELGRQKVQGLDYAYTVGGWTKALNSAALTPETDMGRDGLAAGETTVPPQYLNTSQLDPHLAFARDAAGFVLDYYEDDFRPSAVWAGANPGQFFLPQTAGSDYANASRELFNGNIRGMVTALDERPFVAESKPFSKVLGRAYRYDGLNRLIGCDAYSNFTGNAWQAETLAAMTFTAGIPNVGSLVRPFMTGYHYDENGNITKLMRTAPDGTDPTVGVVFDDLSYVYTAGTNRLERVAEAETTDVDGIVDYDIDHQSATNYAYDASGNLISDAQEEIAEIFWTAEGKVWKVVREETSEKPDLEYRYDAGGKRICKIVKPRNGSGLLPELDWVYTWYVRDPQGQILSTYRKGVEKSGETECGESTFWTMETLRVEQSEIHLYGSSRLGIWKPGRIVYEKIREWSCEETEVLEWVMECETLCCCCRETPVPFFFSWPCTTGAAYPCQGYSCIISGDTCVDGYQITGCELVQELVPGPDLPTVVDSTESSAVANSTVDLRFYRGDKRYEISNHLGNVLVVVSDRKLWVSSTEEEEETVFDHYLADLYSVQDYDPFGMTIPERSWSAPGGYRFGFNGKEKDAEVNGDSYDFGARIYDPRKGMWMSIDAYADTYPQYSPYSFAGNSPVALNDIDGDIIGTVIGAVIGGVRAAKHGGNVWVGIGKGAAAGAVADLAAFAVISTAGAATPLVVAAAGVASGVTGSVADQLLFEDKVDWKDVAISGAIGGGLGYGAAKLAPVVRSAASSIYNKIIKTGRVFTYQSLSSNETIIVDKSRDLIWKAFDEAIEAVDDQKLYKNARDRGNKIHEEAYRRLKFAAANENININTEETFLRGQSLGNIPVSPKGSSRIDIVIRNEKKEIIYLFDLKTGDACLSGRQIQKAQTNVPSRNNAGIEYEAVKE